MDDDLDPHAAAAAMMAAEGNEDDDEAATHVDASQIGDEHTIADFVDQMRPR